MYTGFFEAHITLALNTNVGNIDRYVDEKISAFKLLCENLNIKPIHITLARGDTPTQIMTSSIHEGNFEVIKNEVMQIAQTLLTNQYAISRIKIEAHPENIGVPNTTNDIMHTQKDNYFECHFKILLENIEDKTTKDKTWENLKNICEKHTAHLSQNAFKTQENGNQERFITQRIYAIGKQEAYKSFQILENALIKAGFQIAKKIVEYCVFDDNESIDKNWLTQEPQINACAVCQEENCQFSN